MAAPDPPGYPDHSAGGRLTLPATLNNLHPFLAFIAEQAALHGLEKEQLNRLELACSELLVNIIEHGCHTSEDTLQVHCLKSGTHFKVCLHDRGPPFVPPKLVLPACPPPVDERRPGGLGLYLAGHMVDSIRYHRKNGENRTVVEVRIP